MSWTTFTLRVETPLFSGDDPASGSTDSPIRVSSIRGALRFWFRAVAAGHGINDLSALWAEEERVFGSVKVPSPIRLRIGGSPSASGQGSVPDWAGGPRHRGFHGAHYLLGQGLWSYRDKLTRPFVAPGRTVKLQVKLSDDEQINRCFLLAMWAWLTYGGLGARTRRGFGRLRCVGIDGELPKPFPTALTVAHDMAGWSRLVTDAIPPDLPRPDQWPALLVEPGDPARPPDFPTLCPSWWAAIDVDQSRQPSFGGALDRAGQAWRNFRTNSATDNEPSQNDHSPEWVSAIHGADRRYPVAALGLPVGYYSTKSKAKAEVNPVLNREPIRRASPVWLLPVCLPDRSWFVLTHVFWARLLPADAALKVTGNIPPTQLDVPTPDLVDQAWNNWLSQASPRLAPDFYSN